MYIKDLIKRRKTLIQGTVYSSYTNYIISTYIYLTVSKIQTPVIMTEALFSVGFPSAAR